MPGRRWKRRRRDDDGGVRSQAIRALGTIGESDAGLDASGLGGIRRPRSAGACRRHRGGGPVGRNERSGRGPILFLLEDANDQVKVQVTKVLPRLAGATPEVIDGLCRRLLEDDSDWVQVYAALALGRLGPAAAAAGRVTAACRPDRGSERTRASDASDRHDPACSKRPRLSPPVSRMRAAIFAGWLRRVG